MARSHVVVLLILATGCDSAAPITPEADASTGPDAGAGTDATGGDDCDLPVDPFDPGVLEDGVRYLASDALAGRGSHTPGDRATREYIEDAFRCVGLVPGGTGGSYRQPFVAPDGTAAANVVGYLPGSNPSLAAEVIVIGAHHDHLGTIGAQIYNGANDNASGTIALIALARALAAQDVERTIGFVAFGYEEHDGNCEGSEYYVDHAPAALAMDRVVYMVDMDMVGTYPRTGELTVYGTTAASQGRAILDGLAASYADLDLAHSGNAGADDSDFQAFADLQIPYVYFETWDPTCYHEPCDDTDRLDFPSMGRIATLGRDLVLALANPP